MFQPFYLFLHGCIHDTNHCRLFLIFYIFLGVSVDCTAKSVSKLSFEITVLPTIVQELPF